MGYPEDEDRIALGLDDDDDDGYWDDNDAPGPDERDRDLMDGSWEQRYYSGRIRHFDWNNLLIALALLAVLGMLLPGVLYILR